ncbi:MAG TPA: hypothetical protein VGN64_19255 [Dyadobacter sp.]|jgi:uncharacterized membrane protein YhhN|nr:hypothetical protein [Dyadobacter sp.]
MNLPELLTSKAAKIIFLATLLLYNILVFRHVNVSSSWWWIVVAVALAVLTTLVGRWIRRSDVE